MSGIGSQILLGQFKNSHDWFKNTVGDAITSDQLHWKPDGKPVPIGAHFIHVVVTEDFFVNTLRGQQPLMAGEYAGKIGASEMPPQGGPWDEWARSVQVDLDQARAYADAVFSATEDYLAEVSDEELAEELDLSSVGFGTMPRHGALSILILNNFSHTGEISVIKGLQGLQGYPF